jgi:hypothetical protein
MAKSLDGQTPLPDLFQEHLLCRSPAIPCLSQAVLSLGPVCGLVVSPAQLVLALKDLVGGAMTVTLRHHHSCFLALASNAHAGRLKPLSYRNLGMLYTDGHPAVHGQEQMLSGSSSLGHLVSRLDC